MTIKKARACLIRIGAGDPESFTAIGGLRTRSITLNATLVDVTNQDSLDGWREALPEAGIKSAAISGAGVFKDDAADAEMRLAFFQQSARNYQIVIPDFGTLQGPFLITALEYGGAHDGELTLSLTLASTGPLAFTAA
ncbi:MAG: phage major tail protein, TP901-1 family [Alphaproteobacteria bacterium]|nr:phage major tail protein, TP901-1 family [Alphaproteobacteria bacterium]